MDDTSRYIVFVATAAKLDGTPITFGTDAKKSVRSKPFKLEFDRQGLWKVPHPDQVWDDLAAKISTTQPNIGQEDFKVTLTAYIAHEATEQLQTLNQIEVPVNACECIEPQPRKKFQKVVRELETERALLQQHKPLTRRKLLKHRLSTQLRRMRNSSK